MPTIGEVFNELAIKAGISQDDENLKGLLSAPELAKIEAPAELVESMSKGLLSIEAAKNNHPDIKKKYFADAYDGMDKQIMALVSEFHSEGIFDDETVNEIKREQSTSKKQALTMAKLKEARSSATSQKDKDAINDQIKGFHDQLRQKDAEITQVKKEAEDRVKNYIKKTLLTEQFGGYKTIYDELPADVKRTTLEALINKALQDNSAKLDVNENEQLVLIREDGSNVFGGDHVQLTPQSFLDKTFAPILKKSGTPTTQPAAHNPTPASGPQTDGGIKSHTNQVLADLEKNSRTSLV